MTPDENLQKPVGYFVYRSNDPALPKPLWVKITPEPVAEKRFNDSSVLPGETYYYYVVPVYADGSAGEPSEVITLETAGEEEWPEIVDD